MSSRPLLIIDAPVLLDAGAVLAYMARNTEVRTRCLAAAAANVAVLLPTVVYAQVERGGGRAIIVNCSRLLPRSLYQWVSLVRQAGCCATRRRRMLLTLLLWQKRWHGKRSHS